MTDTCTCAPDDCHGGHTIQIHDGPPVVCLPASELEALRARVAELEAAQRASRCQVTTVDPSNPDRPSCAWCVLPAGHQGMHRAELPQDHLAPAILEWPSEVAD